MTLKVLSLFFRTMTSSRVTLVMPVNVRGMKVLDREKFLRNLEVPILKVTAATQGSIIPLCKAYLLKLEQFKPVCDLDSSEDSVFNKYICLNPDIISEWTDIKEEDRQKMKQLNVDENNFFKKKIQLTYDNWKYEHIFKAVLPEDEESVSGFTQIGHIIHLNLKPNLLEYRTIIGQVLIDKIKTCRTVVNKCNAIDNTYRNFEMEVIAGEEDFFVTVKENDVIFQFDFSKVYWNSRLGKEHERILSFLKPGDVLFDIFCGVGPFALPALKKKCTVFANDLNPDCYKWLNHNARNIKDKTLNSVFYSYNRDGKDFICTIFKDFITELCEGTRNLDKTAKIHITMNLPAIAVTFLKYFKGLINEDVAKNLKNELIVYVYCFVSDSNVDSAKELVIDNLGSEITYGILDVFNVRHVSPKKNMMRVTLKLNSELLSDKSDLESEEEPPNKKVCVEHNK